MTDQSPFAPFQPSPPVAPEQPAKAETAKQKASRFSRAAKAAAKPYPDQTDRLLATAPRQRRKAAPGLKTHAPKFDLQTTLAAASTLNEGDFPLFEKLIIMLDEAGKPQRDRLLAAVGKIFA